MRPIGTFERPGLLRHDGIDGLDFYRGVFGWVDGVAVALKAHSGNPAIGGGHDRLVTLYLSPGATDPDEVDGFVELVRKAFELGGEDVWWGRRDGLDDPRHAIGTAAPVRGCPSRA